MHASRFMSTVAAALTAMALPAACAVAAPVCGDMNRSGTVSANDALLVLKKAVGAPAALQCAPPGFPLKTGQTMSYGAGDDGDVQAGLPPAYTDNGDGTITDRNTGLMWEKKRGGVASMLDGLEARFHALGFRWQPQPPSLAGSGAAKSSSPSVLRYVCRRGRLRLIYAREWQDVMAKSILRPWQPRSMQERRARNATRTTQKACGNCCDTPNARSCWAACTCSVRALEAMRVSIPTWILHLSTSLRLPPGQISSMPRASRPRSFSTWTSWT